MISRYNCSFVSGSKSIANYGTLYHKQQFARKWRTYNVPSDFMWFVWSKFELLLFQLEQELMRLERLLEMPVEPYPRLTEELLYMLPETAVDGTPDTRRRRGDLLR